MKNDSLIEQVAICYAGYLVLTMEKNGLLSNLTIHDIKINPSVKELENESKKSVKYLEQESLKAIKFVSKTTVIAKKIEKLSMAIIDRFFELKLHATSGVYPELLFTCLLFSYFVEKQKNKRHVLFSKISDPSHYYPIFDMIEDVDEVSWLSHTQAADYMLHGGLKPKL